MKNKKYHIILFGFIVLVITLNINLHIANCAYKETTIKQAEQLLNKDKSIDVLTKENLSLNSDIKEKELIINELNDTISTINNEQDIKMTYLGKFTLTYYCISGTTASGLHTMENITVAVDPDVIPLHTALYIDGLGARLAHDTGGAIKGNKIDIYVNDYDKAIQNGVTKDVDVWIIK